jgi:hypothetical protein
LKRELHHVFYVAFPAKWMDLYSVPKMCGPEMYWLNWPFCGGKICGKLRNRCF